MCVSLVAGNMIGSGIFLLPASLGPYGGISLVGWGITTAGAMCLALVFARLARIAPSAGGPYAYTRLGFGEFAGFLVAWGYWISILATNAAIAVAFVSYLSVFQPALSTNNLAAGGLALATIWGLTWVNAIGVRLGGSVQLVTTLLKLIPLVAIAAAGLLRFDAANLQPLADHAQSPFRSTTAAVALTLWAFLGLESATIPADDVKDPRRTIPRATLLGTSLAAVVYVASTLAVMGLIASERLAASGAPFADAARILWGSRGGYLIGAGAAISCFGALNGWILLQGQIPLAAARDGLFPDPFRRVSGSGTPVLGLVLSSALVTALMVTNYARALVSFFNFAILLATLTCLVPYVFSTLAEWMIRLRGRPAGATRGFVGPPVVAALAFLYSMWAIAGSGPEVVTWGFLVLMSGLPVYVWMKRSHARS
jgi:APA family basic amino acid/polyamine antiporter